MAPVRLTPRRNLRRLIRILTSGQAISLSYITLLYVTIQSSKEFRRPHQGYHHFFEVEASVPELYEEIANGFLVRGGFQTAIGVAENLAHDAFLAHRAIGQDASQLLFIGECRVRQTRDLPFRIERQIDSLRGRADRLL